MKPINFLQFAVLAIWTIYRAFELKQMTKFKGEKLSESEAIAQITISGFGMLILELIVMVAAWLGTE